MPIGQKSGRIGNIGRPTKRIGSVGSPTTCYGSSQTVDQDKIKTEYPTTTTEA